MDQRGRAPSWRNRMSGGCAEGGRSFARWKSFLRREAGESMRYRNGHDVAPRRRGLTQLHRRLSRAAAPCPAEVSLSWTDRRPTLRDNSAYDS